MPFIDHFDLLAPLYESFIPLHAPEKIIQIAALPIDGALLDVGGGTGRVAKALRHLSAQTIVADLSVGMLRQIEPGIGIEAVNSQSEYLPFESNAFERVFMIDALHHVIDQQRTVDELWRVLKPGGRLIIGEPDVRKFSVKLVALGEKLALMRSHFIEPYAIGELFRDPCAHVQIHEDGFNAWVLINRLIN